MALVPPYTYAAIVAAKMNRFDLVLDVDLGFGLWRRGVTTRVAGKGATAQVAQVQPGQRIIVATERAKGHYLARIQPDDVKPAYTYTAVLLDGHDGDNVRANISLGFDCWMRQASVRLDGCNARELDEPGGPEAAANMPVVAPAGTNVLLRSVKDDKYGGRYNGVVILPSGMSLTEVLVATQWAAAWDGRGKKPVPPWPRTA